MIIRKLESADASTVISAMEQNIDVQEDAYLGPFWYDSSSNELYGVVKALAEDCPWYQNRDFGTEVRTGRALHQSVWKKEALRGKDKRFSGDYRLKPRGRVFEFKDQGFVVCVGDWIDKYPDAIQEILFEFNLPADKTTVMKNEHWNLGHGWSKEF